MPNSRSPSESARRDPWLLLAQTGKVDKQGLAVICCWECWEKTQEIPFLKEIERQVCLRFGISISRDCASKGRALFQNWLFMRDQ